MSGIQLSNASNIYNNHKFNNSNRKSIAMAFTKAFKSTQPEKAITQSDALKMADNLLSLKSDNLTAQVMDLITNTNKNDNFNLSKATSKQAEQLIKYLVSNSFADGKAITTAERKQGLTKLLQKIYHQETPDQSEQTQYESSTFVQDMTNDTKYDQQILNTLNIDFDNHTNNHTKYETSTKIDQTANYYDEQGNLIESDRNQSQEINSTTLPQKQKTLSAAEKKVEEARIAFESATTNKEQALENYLKAQAEMILKQAAESRDKRITESQTNALKKFTANPKDYMRDHSMLSLIIKEANRDIAAMCTKDEFISAMRSSFPKENFTKGQSINDREILNHRGAARNSYKNSISIDYPKGTDVDMAIEQELTVLYEFMTQGSVNGNTPTKEDIFDIQTTMMRLSKDVYDIVANNGKNDGYFGIATFGGHNKIRMTLLNHIKNPDVIVEKTDNSNALGTTVGYIEPGKKVISSPTEESFGSRFEYSISFKTQTKGKSFISLYSFFNNNVLKNYPGFNSDVKPQISFNDNGERIVSVENSKYALNVNTETGEIFIGSNSKNISISSMDFDLQLIADGYNTEGNIHTEYHNIDEIFDDNVWKHGDIGTMFDINLEFKNDKGETFFAINGPVDLNDPQISKELDELIGGDKYDNLNDKLSTASTQDEMISALKDADNLYVGLKNIFSRNRQNIDTDNLKIFFSPTALMRGMEFRGLNGMENIAYDVFSATGDFYINEPGQLTKIADSINICDHHSDYSKDEVYKAREYLVNTAIQHGTKYENIDEMMHDLSLQYGMQDAYESKALRDSFINMIANNEETLILGDNKQAVIMQRIPGKNPINNIFVFGTLGEGSKSFSIFKDVDNTAALNIDMYKVSIGAGEIKEIARDGNLKINAVATGEIQALYTSTENASINSQSGQLNLSYLLQESGTSKESFFTPMIKAYAGINIGNSQQLANGGTLDINFSTGISTRPDVSVTRSNNGNGDFFDINKGITFAPESNLTLNYNSPSSFNAGAEINQYSNKFHYAGYVGLGAFSFSAGNYSLLNTGLFNKAVNMPGVTNNFYVKGSAGFGLGKNQIKIDVQRDKFKNVDTRIGLNRRRMNLFAQSSFSGTTLNSPLMPSSFQLGASIIID